MTVSYEEARAEVEAMLRADERPFPSVHRELIRALLSGPPEPSVEDVAWQPIESAPTDGRNVLVFCPRASDHGYKRIRLTWRKDGKWQGANNTLWPPTHWRPLPAPPTNPQDER